jgi:uncharacterized protein YndB with AHSA1/START domain
MKSEVSSNENRLQITRVLHAPRPLVFSYWAQAEKYQQWSGCKDAIGCEVTMDFRVGGAFTQKMQIAAPAGTCEFAMTGVYDEIVEPERIGYSANFGPMTAHVTVEFFEQGDATKVVVTYERLPDEFIRQNISQGTSESFDKLDLLLANQAVAARR